MKISEALRESENILKEAGKEEAELKAKLLILDILNFTKVDYVLKQNEDIEEDILIKYNKGIERLKQDIPLEYITGKAYFLGNEYIVNENVLIPRLDTEIIVSKAIDLVKKHNLKKILEIGTGSGIIGISLAKNTNAEVTVTDISKEALKIAEINAERLNVDFKRYKLIQSDVYEKIKDSYDLIISNPPYIKTKEMKSLNKDVLNEPKLALDGGENGFKIYTEIIENAYKYINGNGSFLLFEIGSTLTEDIKEILEKNNWTNTKVLKDFSGLDRVILSER